MDQAYEKHLIHKVPNLVGSTRTKCKRVCFFHPSLLGEPYMEIVHCLLCEEAADREDRRDGIELLPDLGA